MSQSHPQSEAVGATFSMLPSSRMTRLADDSVGAHFPSKIGSGAALGASGVERGNQPIDGKTGGADARPPTSDGCSVQGTELREEQGRH